MSTDTPSDVTVSGAPAAATGARAALARGGRTLDAILDRYPYPQLGPAPRGPLAIAALVVVALMAAAFATFFIVNVSLLHAAFQTHAEDLGIYDQAMWNATHGTGAFFHQTICDVIGDTNCIGDVPRTAIHFEPILLLIAPFYALIPSPLTLVVIQALVVATGAFPAHWLASRRLGTPLAGVAFAALYLAFPALQAALGSDFHAVTLSAAFVLFALYFMLARNDLGLWIACVLAMTTKEEMPLIIIMIGLSVWLLQRRTRLGLSLIGVAAAYLGLALLVMHLSSPIGHSPTASRYAYLGGSATKAAIFILTHPVQVIRQHLLAPDRIEYLRKLLAPTGYLALLSPLTLLIAAPELAINMLSTDPTMYSGIYQYNADIVPVLVVAAIESVAMLVAVARWYIANVPAALTTGAAGRWVRAVPSVVLMVGILFAPAMGARSARRSDLTPLAAGFHWPAVTAHNRLASSVLSLIPANASVSAQTDLVPHVSERRAIYLFPDHAATADYVLLDVTSNIFPLQNTPTAYYDDVSRLLSDGQHRIVAARDGYLLLARGSAGAPITTLPTSFYTFAHASAPPANALDVRFGSALQLVGYDVSPAGTVNLGISGLTIITYWRASGPVPVNILPQIVLFPSGGAPQVVTDLPAVQWLAPQRWSTGATYLVATRSTGSATGASSLGIGARVVSGSGADATPLPVSVSPAGSSVSPTVDATTGAAIFTTVPIIP
jgi:uncharacterized membrane protein